MKCDFNSGWTIKQIKKTLRFPYEGGKQKCIAYFIAKNVATKSVKRDLKATDEQNIFSVLFLLTLFILAFF